MKKIVVIMIAVMGLVFAWCMLPAESGPNISSESEGPSIKSIIYDIKDQEFETIAAFDVNGQLLFDTTDRLHGEVTMSAEQVEQFGDRNGALIVHNHPGSTSFSAGDLQVAAKMKTCRTIVVTYDRLYILSPGWRGWGDPDELRTAHEKYGRYYTKLANEAESWDSILGRSRWICDQTVAAVAQDFGLDYRQVMIKDLLCFNGIQVVTNE